MELSEKFKDLIKKRDALQKERLASKPHTPSAESIKSIITDFEEYCKLSKEHQIDVKISIYGMKESTAPYTPVTTDITLKKGELTFTMNRQNDLPGESVTPTDMIIIDTISSLKYYRDFANGELTPTAAIYSGKSSEKPVYSKPAFDVLIHNQEMVKEQLNKAIRNTLEQQIFEESKLLGKDVELSDTKECNSSSELFHYQIPDTDIVLGVDEMLKIHKVYEVDAMAEYIMQLHPDMRTWEARSVASDTLRYMDKNGFEESEAIEKAYEEWDERMSEELDIF